MNDAELKFQMKQKVSLAESGETGIIIARSEHLNSEPQYLLRYKSADGRQTECWWGESAIVDAPAA